MVLLLKTYRKGLIISTFVVALLLIFSEESQGQDQNKNDAYSSSDTYPHKKTVNHPLEPGKVIDDIVPQPGSVFDIGVGKEYFDWKNDLYDKIGLKYEVSYHLLFQSASEVLPDASYNQALGQWWGFLTKWALVNKGKKNKGGLVFSMFDRRGLGNNATPSNFGIMDVGGITTNVEFTYWTYGIENLYWEQWLNFEKHDFMFRIGNQVVTVLLDPFRYKDSRVSFTTGPFCFHPTMPYPTFGFGAGFKWLPSKGSGLYLAGSLNDMNGDPNLQGFNWSTVSRGEFFYGFEVGYNWKRSKDDYDHLHILVFYADERSTRNPDTMPNKAGGGFSILGEKQLDRLVGFAKYTYNTAQGGGVTGSFSEQTFTAGLAYKNPLNIKGEFAAGFLHMVPFEEIFGEGARNQSGLETYWRVLLTRNIWVTPGWHFVFNPTLNTDTDFVSIPQIKFRLAL